MSSRAWRGLLALVATGVAPAADATAQLLDTEESLVARVEALAPLVETARIEAEAARANRLAIARRLAESVVTLDTLQIGDVSVITPVEDAARAREIFEAAWARSFELVESVSLPHWTFTFQAGNGDHVIFVDSDAQQRHIEIEWWQSHDDAIAVVRSAIGHAVTRDLFETNLGDWSSGDPLADHDPQMLYRLLATTASGSVRDCLTGDPGACGTALDLGEDATIEEWYTPEERRLLAMGSGLRPSSRDLSERYSRCAHDRDYAVCDEFLAMQERDRDYAPLPGLLRASLVGKALETGGEGAWARLVEASDRPVDEALAYTAGIDVDRLVTEWHEWIVENRPEVHGSLAGTSALATLWILFFASLAMRSTRWRLG